jgi:hypothetical protein
VDPADRRRPRPVPSGTGPAPAPPSAGRPDPKSASELTLLAGFLGVLTASVLLGPGVDGVRFLGVEIPSFCLFHQLTGWRCPGCGLTRSFVYLGHGHPIAAFWMHPLGPVLYLVVIQQAVVRSWQTVRALGARRRGSPATGPAAASRP